MDFKSVDFQDKINTRPDGEHNKELRASDVNEIKNAINYNANISYTKEQVEAIIAPYKNYQGRYLSEASLISTLPIGEPGWNVVIDPIGLDAYLMLWDLDDNKWVQSTSNILGITAQQAADILLNNAARVTSQETNLWANKASRYIAGQIITVDMGTTHRYFNGELIELKETVTLPYTCPADPLLGIETFVGSGIFIINWYDDLLSENPPLEQGTISPKNITPNTTRRFQINAPNINLSATAYLGTDIIIDPDSYLYDLDNAVMTFLATSNNNLGFQVNPTANNGREITLDQLVTISEGNSYEPDSAESPWLHKNNSLAYSLGGVRNFTTSNYKSGTFTDGVPVDSDCSLTIKNVLIADEWQHVYFGFGDSTGVNSIPDAVFRSYMNYDTHNDGKNYGQNSSATALSMTDRLSGSTITLKKIVQAKVDPSAPTFADIEVYQNGVLQHTFNSVSVSVAWYPFLYLLGRNNVIDIELLIL